MAERAALGVVIGFIAAGALYSAAIKWFPDLVLLSYDWWAPALVGLGCALALGTAGILICLGIAALYNYNQSLRLSYDPCDDSNCSDSEPKYEVDDLGRLPDNEFI